MATFKIIQDVPVKSTADLRKIAAELNEDFVLINTKPFPCELGYLSLERFAEIAEYTDADMLYSDQSSKSEVSRLCNHDLKVVADRYKQLKD